MAHERNVGMWQPDDDKTRARCAALAEEVRERAMLDKAQGLNRPKCRICGGRMDAACLIGRCPWCGTADGGVGV